MTSITEPNRPVTDGHRRPNGQFAVGNSGKPKGARHRFNKQVLDQLGGLTTKAFATLEKKLDEGELKAATFILARFLPTERVIDISASDPLAVADAVGDEGLTMTEANRLAQAVKTLKEAAGVDEMRARLDEIERLLTARGRGQ